MSWRIVSFHADVHNSSPQNAIEKPAMVVTPQYTTQNKYLTPTNDGEGCNFSQNVISDLENRQPSCPFSTGKS